MISGMNKNKFYNTPYNKDFAFSNPLLQGSENPLSFSGALVGHCLDDDDVFFQKNYTGEGVTGLVYGYTPFQPLGEKNGR